MKPADRDSFKHTRSHQAVVQRKRERVQGLLALVQMWENSGDNHLYVLELKRRLRCAQNQLLAMGEELDENFQITKWD